MSRAWIPASPSFSPIAVGFPSGICAHRCVSIWNCQRNCDAIPRRDIIRLDHTLIPDSVEGRSRDYIVFCSCSLFRLSNPIHHQQLHTKPLQLPHHTAAFNITTLLNTTQNTQTPQTKMSVNRNIESVAEQGEFHARVPRSEPLTTKGVSLHPNQVFTTKTHN